MNIKNISTIIASFFVLGVFFLYSPLQTFAATESVRIIRQDCTGYANCYTSLSAWEAAENRNLVASDEIAVARIEGTWTAPDTTAVTIDGWTTDATRYVKIYTAPEARHAGVWSTGKYRLETNNVDALTISDDYVKVDGIQIGIVNATVQRREFSSFFNQTGEVTLSNSIIRGSGANSVGLNINSPTCGSINLYNNIIYNTSNTFFGGVRYSGAGTLRAYNNTIVGSFYGIRRSAGIVIAKNNIVSGSVSSAYLSDGGVAWGAGSNYNISSDSTSTSGANDKVNQTVTFVDSLNNNFHLSPSDTSAKDAGIDLSTDPSLAFTTDIDGDIRSGLWDIGADETSGGGVPPPPDTTAPTTPTNLTATAISTTQINLSWSASTDTVGVSGYRIYRGGVQIATSPSATYSDTALTASTLYSYTVLAYDAAGNTSSQSTGASATTQAEPLPDTTAPSIPTTLTATAVSASQINLSWSASTDNTAVTGYRIYRNGTQLTTTTTTTYQNTGLSASTLYTYTVLAYDGAGNTSAQSTGASATTQAQGVVTTTTGAPIILYTDITSGPNTGGENNNGAYLSIFGKNFGTNIANVKVYVGNGEVVRYMYLGASKGRSDIQQISVQLGNTVSTGAIKVSVNGVDSNLDHTFTVRSGEIFFVSLTGSDTGGVVNDINNPYRTVNHVVRNLSTFTAGDFVVVRGGTYDLDDGTNNITSGSYLRANKSGVVGSPMTFMGYPGEAVNLRADSQVKVFSNYDSISNWVVSGLNVILNHCQTFGDVFDVGNTAPTSAICSQAFGSVLGFAQNINIVNIDIDGRGTGGNCSGHDAPLMVGYSENVKVFGVSIHDTSTLLENTESAHQIYLNVRQQNTEVGWNSVYNIPATRAVIQIHQDDYGCFGTKALTGIKIHDNIVHNVAGQPLLADGGTGDIDIYNNIFYGAGLPNDHRYDDVISLRGSGGQLNVKLYNNTVYVNPYYSLPGFILWMGGVGSSYCPQMVTLSNNIFYVTEAQDTYFTQTFMCRTNSYINSSNNIWYGSSAGLPSFAGPGDRVVNPLFTSPSTGDFSLQSLSTAIDTGISLVSNFVTKDYFGISRPQGSAYDIGAYEYCTNCTTTVITQPTTDITAPSIPTALSATAISSSQINLSWSASTDNTAVTGYRIYRNGTQLTTTTGTTYQNTSLTPSTLYTYTVVAYDGAGNNSSQSTSASATTQAVVVADTTAPTIGTISSSVTTTGATISWTTNEAGTSRVEYGLTTSYGNSTSLTTTPSTSHSHTLSSLSSNTTYHYRVTTTDSSGNSAVSQDRTFTTSSVADTTAPSSITDLTTSSLGQTSLTLSWTVPTDTSGIASYDIRYSTSPITDTTFSSAPQLANVPLPTTSGTTQTQYVSVGLTPATTYSFAIKSTDAVGNVSSISNIATGTTLSAPTTTSPTPSTQTGTISVPTSSGGGGGGGSFTIYQLSDITPPKNPADVRILPTNTQAVISWTNPTDPDFVRVKIVRKTGSAVSSHTDGTTVYDGTGTTFTDTNLVNNQTYYYAIYAYDKASNYTSTLGLSVTPQASLTQTNVSYTTIEAGCTETTTYSTITGKPCTKVPTAFRPSHTFSNDRSVTYGMKDSTDVRELQKILQFEGLLSLTSSADGSFGPGTKTAVIAFQKKYNISPSQGTVGPLTKTKLNQLYGSTTSSSTFYRNLTIGSKGEDVKKLQQLLNTDIETRIASTGAGSPGNETTTFGPATKAAVMKYQKKYNIAPVSGYVGPLTRGKLEGR